jgi:hypothetical protein
MIRGNAIEAANFALRRWMLAHVIRYGLRVGRRSRSAPCRRFGILARSTPGPMILQGVDNKHANKHPSGSTFCHGAAVLEAVGLPCYGKGMGGR